MADPKRPPVLESELIDVIWRAASAETLSAGDWLDLAAADVAGDVEDDDVEDDDDDDEDGEDEDDEDDEDDEEDEDDGDDGDVDEDAT
jgi:hypothetical protein